MRKKKLFLSPSNNLNYVFKPTFGTCTTGANKRLLPEEFSIYKGCPLAPSWDTEKPSGYTICSPSPGLLYAISHPHAFCHDRPGCLVLREWPLSIGSFQKPLQLPSGQEMCCWPPTSCLSADLRSLVSDHSPGNHSGWQSAVLSCWVEQGELAAQPSSSAVSAAAGQWKQREGKFQSVIITAH